MLLLLDGDPFKVATLALSALTAAAALYSMARGQIITRYEAWRDRRLIERANGASLYPDAVIENATRYYVRPRCQDADPAGVDEPRADNSVSHDLFKRIDTVLGERHTYARYILLADSGMGKTSFLLNYYARHLRKWRRPYKLAVMPLSHPDVDERIVEVKDKRETVVFLDALDEDQLALVDYLDRLDDLFEATREFRGVLITCRTQFFPRDDEIPTSTGTMTYQPRKAGMVAAIQLDKLYLSPLSDRDVARYIAKRYPPWQRRARRKAWSLVRKIPHLAARPMLLAHVEDLVESGRSYETSVKLYDVMVDAWFEREKPLVEDDAALREFSARMAVDVYNNSKHRGGEYIPFGELEPIARTWGIDLESWQLSGRSLLNRDAAGNYKFAHRSIMEYLFVKEFFDGNTTCLDAKWTDQMKAFFAEHYVAEAKADVKPEPRLSISSLSAADIERLRDIVASPARLMEVAKGASGPEKLDVLLTSLRDVLGLEGYPRCRVMVLTAHPFTPGSYVATGVASGILFDNMDNAHPDINSDSKIALNAISRREHMVFVEVDGVQTCMREVEVSESADAHLVVFHAATAGETGARCRDADEVMHDFLPEFRNLAKGNRRPKGYSW